MGIMGGGGSGMSQTQADARYNPLAVVKAVRTGLITTAVIDGVAKAVTFATAMPSTDYEVFLQTTGNLAVAVWPTSKTTSGFTLNVSLAVAGSISYLAVQN